MRMNRTMNPPQAESDADALQIKNYFALLRIKFEMMIWGLPDLVGGISDTSW